MFAAVTKSERNGPVFRFFMDLGDAGIAWPCIMSLYLLHIVMNSRCKYQNLMSLIKSEVVFDFQFLNVLDSL